MFSLVYCYEALKVETHIKMASAMTKAGNLTAALSEIDKTRTTKISIGSYYYFILFYRKYQLSTHLLPKYLYLLGAILSNPMRLLKRLVRKPW